MTILPTSNSAWQDTLSKVQTILPDDLFLIFCKSAPLSLFVREVFSGDIHTACRILEWHFGCKDELLAVQLETLYSEWCADGKDSNQPFIREAAIMSQLRRFRRYHSAAIAVLELSDTLPIESTSLRISLLADFLILRAYEWSHAEVASRFGTPRGKNERPLQLMILAMGKLGGFELNFSSDIDLIFFYPEEGETSGAARSVENSRFFRRVSTLLIKLLDEVTEDGFVFRVDMRLRPYGDSGALVMSLAQAEEYYQEQGREWERFAMVRCRVLSGEAVDRKHLDDVLQPFSFRRYIDFGVIESIRSMKAMIQREVRRKGLHDNIKLGAGGIREVEFIVQSLQLIQGGRDKRLREKNILKVLPMLVDAKLLPRETQQQLSEAYRFLRRLEHCIQQLAEKQTQQLPVVENEQCAVATAMGFSSWQQLLEKLQAYRIQVNDHFEALLGEDRKQALTQDDFYHSLAEGHIELTQLIQRQQQNSLCDDESLLNLFIEQIDSFLNETDVLNLSARGNKRLKAFFPALLAGCLSTDAPQVTLARLLKILRAILKRTAYLELLSENPPVLQHLIDLAGQSEWIVARLSEYPVLFDELLYPNSLYVPLQTADLQSELQQTMLRIDQQDEEELLDALRTFKQINELRVAAAMLAERLSISQVNRYLTQLAEVVLASSAELCWRVLIAKHGAPEGVSQQFSESGFAVVGYGKLGGIELGFGSDLDLVFLYNQPVEAMTTGKKPLSNSRLYTRLAQKLIHFLSTRTNLGLLYEVDMRLRPSGSSGLLVSHINAYQEYQMESAWTWEHQALIRARFIAGDLKLQLQFNEIRKKVLLKKRDLNQLKNDVVGMRIKMRDQLEKKITGKIDLKQSEGGLVDIEFIAQYCCLANVDDADIPNRTAACLNFAQREKLLDEGDAKVLIKNYRLLRNQLNAMALREEGRQMSIEQAAKMGIVDGLGRVKEIWKKIFED